ncbi:MAG: MBL fold metallo-hydrolase [Hyphomicrobiaceae bacterium]|nr:MBL fold metallo-hydrolase [Hyphomicrobiaceae bacterium]
MSPALEIGDIKIRRIVEQEGPFFPVHDFFPKFTKEMMDENRSWLQPRYVDADGLLNLCIQSYVVETRHHKIMIDTCVGNHKPRPARAFWHMMQSDRYEKGLAAAGLKVDDIDFVMCTHLHVDHVGWNTRLENGRWVPTFPKARYVFADRELAFWTDRHKQSPELAPWMTDSVLPIVAADRADVVKSDYAFNDLVQLVPAPGHTIDQYCVLAGKSGKDALVTGDMVHSPIQVKYPEIGMMSDWDSRVAGETRQRLFSRFCDTSTLICTAHFPQPSSIRIVGGKGGGFGFVEA